MGETTVGLVDLTVLGVSHILLHQGTARFTCAVFSQRHIIRYLGGVC